MPKLFLNWSGQMQGFLNPVHKFVDEKKAGGSWERAEEVYFWWMVLTGSTVSFSAHQLGHLGGSEGLRL